MPKSRLSVAITVAVLVAIFFIYFFWFRGYEIKNLSAKYPGSNAHTAENIVAFGDSLIYGVGSSPGNDFVSVLSNKVNRPIINLGVPGNTTADGLGRINEALAYNPRVLILLLGGNDAIRKIPVEQTFSNLEEMIKRVQGHGAVVILLGVRGGLLVDSFESKYKDLAKRTGSLYVSNVLSGLFAHADLMSDAVHPNDKGYAMIAERVLPALKLAMKGEND